MLNPIYGNGEAKPILSKQNNKISRKSKEIDEQNTVPATGGDKVNISSAAIDRQRNTLLVETALKVLRNETGVRNQEVNRTAKNVVKGVYYQPVVNQEIATGLMEGEGLKVDDLEKEVSAVLVQSKSKVESSDNDLTKIQKRIEENYYDQDNVLKEVVNNLWPGLTENS